MQSSAALRYAGSIAGLYPTDPLARLGVDEVRNASHAMFPGTALMNGGGRAGRWSRRHWKS